MAWHGMDIVHGMDMHVHWTDTLEKPGKGLGRPIEHPQLASASPNSSRKFMIVTY